MKKLTMRLLLSVTKSQRKQPIQRSILQHPTDDSPRRRTRPPCHAISANGAAPRGKRPNEKRLY